MLINGASKTSDIVGALMCRQIIRNVQKHIKHCLKHITLDGPCMEFGVFRGHSLNKIAKFVAPRKVYGFDSFHGLPADWKNDMPAGSFNLDGKPPRVRENVELVIGWFEDTLPAFVASHQDDVAFINVDCDLYTSTKTVLNELNTCIAPGTVIYFDELTDWGGSKKAYPDWPQHEIKALQEWLAYHKRDIIPLSRNGGYSAAFIVEK